ncbi:hypothetical protein VKT23_002824 [Stygiomarasmius scandens]|uniref:F-box domain-containing protein n=1 Tax=Marasmiellus scandens TaxID=2682957 RepID=A0ABR1JVV9_9AGAR
MPRTRKSRQTISQPALTTERSLLPAFAFSLPQELISLVIQHLRDCISSLRNCALVCRSWRYPAQSLLFDSLCLYNADACNKLNRILRVSPILATHVHQVLIRARYPFNSFLHLRNATSVFERLCNVRELSISFYRDYMPNELINLAKLRTVEILRLYSDNDFAVIPFLWKAYPNIHTLQLLQAPDISVFASRYTHMPVDELVESGTKTLRALALSNIESTSRTPLLRFFTRPEIDYSSLQSLKLLWGGKMKANETQHLDFLNALLKKCGFHARSVTLVFPQQSTWDTLDLLATFLSERSMKYFQSMENLILLLDFGVCLYRHSSVYSHKLIIHVLSLVKNSPANVRCLTLDVFLKLGERSSSSPDSNIGSFPEWKALDALLSDSSRKLAKFEVRVSAKIRQRYVRDNDLSGLGQKEVESIIQAELTEIFESCLQATNRAGKLSIRFRTIQFWGSWTFRTAWDIKARTGTLPGAQESTDEFTRRDALQHISTSMPSKFDIFRYHQARSQIAVRGEVMEY